MLCFGAVTCTNKQAIMSEAVVVSDTPDAVYRKVKPSVVVILIKTDKLVEPRFAGTGFVINTPESTIITAAHVVDSTEPGTKYFIRTELNEVVEVTPFLAEKNDVAILKPKKKIVIPGLELAAQDPAVGTPIWVIGHPSPDFGIVYWWVISPGLVNHVIEAPGFVTEPDSQGDTLGISASLIPGNSGSPVVNAKGEVVGIGVAGFVFIDDLNFAVPVSTIKEELTKILLH